MERTPQEDEFTSEPRVHDPRVGRPLGVGRSGRGCLVGRWRGWGERLANRQPHRSDILLLLHDDFLGDAPELLVAAITQLSLRHVDRTLMMRNHRRDEVSVHVAGGLQSMAAIIFAMAASFSARNSASILVARDVAPPISATANSADRAGKRAWGKRYIGAPFTTVVT